MKTIHNIRYSALLSFAVLVTGALACVSCADGDMVGMPATEPDSLAQQDDLRQLDVLKRYAPDNFKVSTLADVSLLTGTGVEARTLYYNFNQVENDGPFSHRNVMTTAGNMMTADAADFLAAAADRGLSVYAGPLVSGDKQNVDYLNNLIKPDVYSRDGSPLTSRCIVMTNNKTGEATEQQVEFSFPNSVAVTPGRQYRLQFWVKGTREGRLSLAVSGGAEFSPSISVTQEWQQVTLRTTMAAGLYTLRTILFRLGEYAGTLYVDNFALAERNSIGRYVNKEIDNANLDDAETTAASIAKVEGASEGITQLTVSEVGEGYDPNTYTVEKTPQVKHDLLCRAVADYVQRMDSVISGQADAVTVVANPLDTTSLSVDNFNYQTYCGNDYAVAAFKAARASGAKLFVAEDSLLTQPSRVDDLVAYLQALEVKGAQVDGISVRVGLTTDEYDDEVANQVMAKLAQTGKLIRLESVEVAYPDGAPQTQAALNAQADVYGKLLQAYNRHVPQSQRYGISLGRMFDGDGASSDLWTADGNRKPAYRSIVENLLQK